MIVFLKINETSGIQTPDNLIKSQVLYHLSYTPIINWASWIRTNECRSQSPVPYRLAIAHYRRVDSGTRTHDIQNHNLAR